MGKNLYATPRNRNKWNQEEKQKNNTIAPRHASDKKSHLEALKLRAKKRKQALDK